MLSIARRNIMKPLSSEASCKGNALASWSLSAKQKSAAASVDGIACVIAAIVASSGKTASTALGQIAHAVARFRSFVGGAGKIFVNLLSGLASTGPAKTNAGNGRGLLRSDQKIQPHMVCLDGTANTPGLIVLHTSLRMDRYRQVSWSCTAATTRFVATLAISTLATTTKTCRTWLTASAGLVSALANKMGERNLHKSKPTPSDLPTKLGVSANRPWQTSMAFLSSQSA